MAQSAHREDRLKVVDQLVVRRLDSLSTHKAIRMGALDAGATILMRDRAILETGSPLGQALKGTASTEELPIEVAAGAPVRPYREGAGGSCAHLAVKSVDGIRREG